ncbi:MAG: NUDIX domain-containing protein [Flaviramulus sp.]|nr:NUDIX domain-containing protein [Flaviramulus sp.]
MDEYIDIVDAEGNQTGDAELKSVIHQKGYYHHTAHIWFYNKEDQILLSQRSAKKIICPLLWDVSVAGHIDSGETPKQAAIRETKEEIGLDISENDLIEIGVFKCFQSHGNDIQDNEFHNTFIVELKAELSELTPQEEEVEALKLISFKKFQHYLDVINDDNNHFIASNKSYYECVLNAIKSIKI